MLSIDHPNSQQSLSFLLELRLRGTARAGISSTWIIRLSVAVISAFLVSAFICTSDVDAQTTRLPGGAPVPLGRSPVDIPQTNLTPIGQGGFSGGGFAGPPPSATLGNPVFDPYATGANAGSYQPALPPGSSLPPSAFGNSNGGLLGGLFSQPASTAPAIGAYPGYSSYPGYSGPGYGSPVNIPAPSYGAAPSLNPAPNYSVTPPGATPWQSSPYGSPPGFAGPPPASYGAPGIGPTGYSTPGFAPSTYPNTIYPSGAPNTLFPGGLFGNTGLGTGANGYSAFRLLQGPRLRHTFINAGDGPNDLQINTTDASIAFAFPNFLYSNQPIYVVPSFSLHQWDGPVASVDADLPANAFDAFVDFGWQTDPNQIIGAELGVRVGVFSSFDAIGSDSVRAMAKGLLSFRLTPTSTIKGGVYFINREERDFIPAFGLMYQPNPYTRLDLFFPEPKLARYWRTLGTYDVWGYVGGEYGGGVWTVKRDNGNKDIVDMYDYKVFLGLEWGESNAIRSGRRTAFAEAGYVFERRLEFQSTNGRDFSLDESFFVRAGFGY